MWKCKRCDSAEDASSCNAAPLFTGVASDHTQFDMLHGNTNRTGWAIQLPFEYCPDHVSPH
eukprot:961111-Amphidinium_carterae.1